MPDLSTNSQWLDIFSFKNSILALDRCSRPTNRIKLGNSQWKQFTRCQIPWCRRGRRWTPAPSTSGELSQLTSCGSKSGRGHLWNNDW